MTQNTRRRPIRHLQIGIPAAIVGTLATTLAAVPAHAEHAASGGPSALQLPSARTTPSQALKTQSTPETYTVRSGDTVWRIAQRHRLRTADLLSWNNLGAAAIIHPGQTLRLTAPAAAPAKPAATPAKSAAAPTHTVAAGDTISAIAKKYGTTVSVVLDANKLSGSSIIYPGQKLLLSAPPAPASVASTPPPQLSATLNARQVENARLIIAVGRELGVSSRGIAIALATSMVESRLRELDYGDRDSLGLFPQRPSTGWGMAEEIQQRSDSIRAFFTGKGTATRGLLDIPNWEKMRFTDAAQAVQISAYPLRYGQWETQAHRWLEQYG